MPPRSRPTQLRPADVEGGPRPVPLARVVRSGIEESVHLGSVVVVGPDGSTIASAGDPGTVAFARSSLKPFQAAVSLRESGEDLSDADLAVMAASHNGEPVHVEAVRAILARAGLDEADLLLPPAFPMYAGVPRSAEPTPIVRDCSGKHAGMLLACARRGWDLRSYLERGHPLQMAVLAEASRVAGSRPVAIGTDGCGLPVPAFSLASLARAFAVLGDGEDPALARVAAAMRTEPYLVAGRDRVCTDLMRAVPGLVAKAGAEGLLGMSVGGRGIAIKVADGSVRALGPVAVATLDWLRIFGSVPEILSRWSRPPVLGGGEEVGVIEATMELTPA